MAITLITVRYLGARLSLDAFTSAGAVEVMKRWIHSLQFWDLLEHRRPSNSPRQRVFSVLFWVSVTSVPCTAIISSCMARNESWFSARLTQNRARRELCFATLVWIRHAPRQRAEDQQLSSETALASFLCRFKPVHVTNYCRSNWTRMFQRPYLLKLGGNIVGKPWEADNKWLLCTSDSRPHQVDCEETEEECLSEIYCRSVWGFCRFCSFTVFSQYFFRYCR